MAAEGVGDLRMRLDIDFVASDRGKLLTNDKTAARIGRMVVTLMRFATANLRGITIH